MNDYIELDGYCYKTIVKTWNPPTPRKPMTVRVNVDGTLDVTYACGRSHGLGWEEGPSSPYPYRTQCRPRARPGEGKLTSI